jgi:O-succinylbenzoate synthase
LVKSTSFSERVSVAGAGEASLTADAVPACASSHNASVVKPTITASIQYCERTASLAWL